MDSAIGVYIIDRYTYYALEFLEKVEADSKKTLGEFVSCADGSDGGRHLCRLDRPID